MVSDRDWEINSLKSVIQNLKNSILEKDDTITRQLKTLIAQQNDLKVATSVINENSSKFDKL